jgi:hypothetical protein
MAVLPGEIWALAFFHKHQHRPIESTAGKSPPRSICVAAGKCVFGMSRRHAQYEMVALVQGTNIVRRELGLPEAACLAADERFSLVVPVA